MTQPSDQPAKWHHTRVSDGTYSVHIGEPGDAPDPVAHDIKNENDARLIASAPKLWHYMARAFNQGYFDACPGDSPAELEEKAGAIAALAQSDDIGMVMNALLDESIAQDIHTEAHLRLTAAAPKMLQALKNVRKALNEDDDVSADEVIAAIKLAEGGAA